MACIVLNAAKIEEQLIFKNHFSNGNVDRFFCKIPHNINLQNQKKLIILQ